MRAATRAAAALTGLALVAIAAPTRAGVPEAAALGSGSVRIGPVLTQTLRDLGPGETTTVLVTLREQADLTATPPDDVVSELQETADRAQEPLQDELDEAAEDGDVLETTPLWVLNAISVTATADVVEELAARPDVARVIPDEVVLAPAAAVAEPNIAAANAPELWNLGVTGQGVVVATLDSGVDFYHPDLSGRWRGGTNSWFDPYGEHATVPTDLSGHGTAAMGTILGGDAGGSSIGVAPGATWIAAKIFDDRGAATVTAVHQAFQWLLDPDHNPDTDDAPQVVSGSWSIGTGPGCDLTFQPDLVALGAAGILPVFSAGNFGPGDATDVSPANYPEALAVGAVTTDDQDYAASSRGPSSCGGRTGVFPDLVAPGVDIRTTDRFGLYQTASGTSMSAPHAAGALALLLEAYPGLSPAQQRAALAVGAADLGAPGPEDQYGAGRLDVATAYQTLAARPDFAVGITPPTATVPSGGTAGYTVQVTPRDGFAGDVTLSLAGPPGVSLAATFSPPVLTGGGTSALQVSATVDTPPGTYPLVLTGTSGSTSRSVDATLTLTEPVRADLLEFSTAGNSNPPAVTGAADDADLYAWNGTAFRRTVDASRAPYLLPSGANVDGFERVDTLVYVSFAADTRVPGLGMVQDEDIVSFDGVAWSVYFDGTAHGLTSPALDIDALDVQGTILTFSTAGSANPPGVRGAADDADLYGWRGRSFARVWDASATGIAASANIDGVSRGGGGALYLSFAANVHVPGLGAVQDEDVVRTQAGGWTVYFDGTAHGLTTDALDVDGFDVA